MVDYRTAGAWGPGLGRNLTPAEVDGNFYSVVSQVNDLISNPPTAAGISNITVSGANMTVYLSDGTSFGPFVLPRAAFRVRGTWTAGTAYFANDIVTVRSLGIYLILRDHTAASTFDADATNSDGDLYQYIFPSNNPIPVRTISVTSYTPGSSDANYYLRCTNPSGCLITLQTSGFELNDELTFRQCSGPLSFVIGDTGGIINVPSGFDQSTDREGAVFTAKYVAEGEWDVFGLLAAATA